MYITHTYTKERKGFLIEAKIMLSTHLVALDSFEVELHFNPKRQHIESVRFHSQLVEAGFMLRSDVDINKKKINLSCSGETGFVTGSEPIVLAVVSFLASSPESELKFGTNTNIRIHEGVAIDVVSISRKPAGQLVRVS